MSKYATGKFAKAISDRSGMEFPYKEMVREWNGAFVHVSEYEPKQPQLEPKPNGADAIALLNVRSDRSEPSTLFSLPEDPFETMQAGSGKINVFAPGHGLTTGQTVVFRGAPTISPGTGTPYNPVTGVNGTSVFAFADIKDFDGIQGSNIQRAARIYNYSWKNNTWSIGFRNKLYSIKLFSFYCSNKYCYNRT